VNGKNSKSEQSLKPILSDEVLDDVVEQVKEKHLPNIWDILAERKKRGLFKGEIEVIKTKEFNLSAGEHYFVIEDVAKASIKCVSCPVSHGGILEPFMLTRYEVKDGVLYLDGKSKNKTPKGFIFDKADGNS